VKGELHVVGTGTFAAEILDWAGAAGFDVVGLVEPIDPARVGTTRHGLPVIAPEDPPPGARAVFGVGGDRRALWEPLHAAGWQTVAVVHPRASVAQSAMVEPGAVIGPLAVIGAETRVGAHASVNRGALLGHHVAIGRFATINPGVNVGGNTTIGTGAVLGMGAVVVNHLTVGDGATVAAGAVAVRDVEAGVRVQGVPARVLAGA
jgi:sugar O-acyltransferase (sialic acid O-acetyltransferase NeuD family)